MEIPPKLRFKLVNGVSESDIKDNKFVIYAHQCSKGIYIGRTDDPVRRWQEHVSHAFNKGSQYYDDNFREAIRLCGPNQFEHYILAVSSYEELAQNKEAAAIDYYGGTLNMRFETRNEHRDYAFRQLETQIGIGIVLEKKSREGAFYSRDDSARTTIIAEISMEYGRKRVRCIAA